MTIRNKAARETLRDLDVHLKVALYDLDTALYHMPSSDERSQLSGVTDLTEALRANIRDVLDP